MAPLGEGAELPRLEGGGAGRGARARPPRRQRDPGLRRPSSHKQNSLGKLCAQRSWEGVFVFSHPGFPLSFQKETVAPCSLPRLPLPLFPPPAGALALGSQPGLGGRGELQASPRLCPARAGPDRASSAHGRVPGALDPLPGPAYSPCPISLPGARELAAASARWPPRSGFGARRHQSETGSEPERGTGRGWESTEW